MDTSRVLEVGFGVGRVGRSIIESLAPDRFCGIEPNAQMLAAGVARLVGRDRLRDKRPRFHLTPDGSFEVFGGRFDFVYSRSVWTHMSKRQIELYLDGYLRVARCRAKTKFHAIDASGGSRRLIPTRSATRR